MKWLCVLALTACDAGVPRSAPEPTKKLVEVPAPPRDAMVPADAAGPTPALRDARLKIVRTAAPPQEECSPSSLHILLIQQGHTIEDHVETSTCTGACTDQEKRLAQDSLDRVQEQVAAGEASPGELDYNFTGCLPTGVYGDKIFRNVGGRDVAIIAERYIGPHDELDTRYLLALEVCGKIFVSEPFGALQAHSWPIERLRARSEADDVIAVFAKGDTKDTSGDLLSLRLPACPAAPRVDTFDVWPIPI